MKFSTLLICFFVISRGNGNDSPLKIVTVPIPVTPLPPILPVPSDVIFRPTQPPGFGIWPDPSAPNVGGPWLNGLWPPFAPSTGWGVFPSPLPGDPDSGCCSCFRANQAIFNDSTLLDSTISDYEKATKLVPCLSQTYITGAGF